MRGWLVDNDVPRSVTRLLQAAGENAIEVRSVLGGDALDAAITAYAEAVDRWVVTKDREFAQRRRATGKPNLWLRTRQTEDRDRLRDRLDETLAAVAAGASQLTMTIDGLLEVQP